MKTATGLALAAVLLAACTTSDNPDAALAVTAQGITSQRPAEAVGPEGAGTADEAIPRVTAAGTSPIKPEVQTAFCHDQVAFMQSVEPQFATAGEPVVAEDGSTTIAVTVAEGNQAIRTFECRLDASNRFVGVTTSTIQGAL